MRFFLALTLAAAIGLAGRSDADPARSDVAPDVTEAAAPESETARILSVLNAETRDALRRDYPGWASHWVHAPYVAKTYVNVADGTGSEMLGWDQVDDFVRTYIETHPEPEPLPSPLVDADVRLYGDGAWVSYVQQDADQGRKREARLMEKVDGAWKIAGMHTTVYGPDAAE